ncbi:MAG: endo-beta-N-acetylglucosaminidase [Cellulosilyticaceae bacterium]
MNKKLTRKLTNLLLIGALSLSTCVTPVMAHQWALAGEAKVMGTNQPLIHGYDINSIKEWSPEADQFSNLLRAHVPLQERNEAFTATQVNPKLSTDVKLTNVNNDYRASNIDAVPYSQEFSQSLYKFWQYTDIYASWHGMAVDGTPFDVYTDTGAKQFEFGVINLPDPAYTNAAHKNGALSLACIFIPRNGQSYAQLLEQDANGTFIVAEKLAEIQEYYGFDGYFINQETSVEPEHIEPYKDFTKALRDLGVYTQWYDCVDDEIGKLKYEPAFIDSHASFVQDKEKGKVNDSIFINYNWNSPDGWNNGDSTDQSYIKKSVETAKNHGINPYDVFMGVECAMGRFDGSHNSTRNMDVIVGEDGNALTSIALFTPSFTGFRLDRDLGDQNQYRRGDDNYQWMIEERERMFYTGVKQDVYDVEEQKGFARPDVGVEDASEWTGVSKYIAERSVINGTTFVTNFNTGHGVDYYKEGKIATTKEWANINLQDILPTWQWRIDTEGTKLSIDYDYGNTVAKNPEYKYTQVGAYNGGSSLAISGQLDADNFVHLYKTDLSVEPSSKLSVTYNKPQASDESTVNVGLIFKDAPEVVEYVEVEGANAQTQGWETATISLAAFKGREIASIGIQVVAPEEAVENFQLNIGQIKITDNKNHTPKAPQNFEITEYFNTNEVHVAWDMESYNKVQQYNLYAKDKKGNVEFLGGSYDGAYHLRTLGQDVVELHLTAVGKDGSESKPAIIKLQPKTQVKNVALENAADGVKVTFEAPEVKHEAIEVVLTIKGVNAPVYTETLEANATEATLAFEVEDGREYHVRISPIDKKGEKLSTVTIAGETIDTFCEDYKGDIYTTTTSKGTFINFTTPEYYDWYRMHIQVNGKTLQPVKLVNKEPVDYFIRGYHPLIEIAAPTEDATITVVLEDYNGNKGNAVTFEYKAK